MSTGAISSKNSMVPSSGFARALPLLFGATILTSACLLFLLQPLISKIILPWFGGSASVWVTSMLFFQTFLLLGYLYAHFLTRLFTPAWQGFIHITLLTLTFLFLPIEPNPRWIPKPGDDPTASVFAVLAACVGLPYMLLSSTSPLIQQWFSSRDDNVLPYRYFALSNAGSLAALFAFPLVMETHLTGHQQRFFWSGAFVGFAILCAASAATQIRSSLRFHATIPSTTAASSTIALWTALSACASALLLIVTHLLTQNIAPMPLLWVLPLGLYLLTFILCFESTLWYRRWVFLPLALPALAYMATTTRLVEDDDLMKIVPLLLASFFIVCMACHGELSRMKPAASQLTTYYLTIAAGGALGGAAIALLAPKFLTTNYEYPVVLTVTAAVLLLPIWRERRSWRYPRIHMSIWLAAAACCLLLGIYSVQQFQANQLEATLLARNFYGSLRVDEFQDQLRRRVHQLNHGTITHGSQFLDNPMRHVATTYYGRESGVGLTWRILEQSGPIRMGVIGLGTGTLAAYGRAGDSLHFYEINPLVVDIANTRFTYLADSAAHLDISLGDARLTLQHQPPENFDILVVDAFSGDAIPVHLLTAEAFHLYLRHLKPNGVLAVHISNRFLKLAPVVKAEADHLRTDARLVSSVDDDSNGVFQADYVLVTNRPNFFTHPLLEGQAAPIAVPFGTRLWTDDYTNIWQTIHFSHEATRPPS